jgi:hypothetical protein
MMVRGRANLRSSVVWHWTSLLSYSQMDLCCSLRLLCVHSWITCL